MPQTVTVAQGDCISSIAFSKGFYPETIWNDPANAGLKNQRTDPNMLVPGDKVVIRDKDPGGVDCASGDTYKFRKRGVPAMFRLQLFENEEPRANHNYSLIVDGNRFQGTTSPDGVLQEYISPSAKKAELTIGPPEAKFEFIFGTLQPIGEIAGVQGRLNNLGYECGPINGQINDKTREALLAFQTRFGLDQTGKPDQPTLDRLKKIHDEVGDFPEPA